MKLKSAVFLDRDGTINEENGYLHKKDDCRFIPGALTAISRLKNAGFLIVVVTNQSGIARGYYSEDDLKSLHMYMESKVIDAGGAIDGWYFCPHHPDYTAGDTECVCRKPLPGMLSIAASELGIDLKSSWMIGDKLADVEAGISAGCRSILVKTGYGEVEAKAAASDQTVFPDLTEAAEYILSMTVNWREKCP